MARKLEALFLAYRTLGTELGNALNTPRSVISESALETLRQRACEAEDALEEHADRLEDAAMTAKPTEARHE